MVNSEELPGIQPFFTGKTTGTESHMSSNL